MIFLQTIPIIHVIIKSNLLFEVVFMIHSLGVFKDFSDGTLKSVFEVDHKKIIEMSLLFNKIEKDVVCVPTHHFCNLGCKMCHLTNKGLNKAMLPIQSADFLECLIYTLTKDGKRRTDKKKLLISFMGVGEPLLNIPLIEEVYKKEDWIKEKLGYEDVAYSIATMMPNQNILKLQEIVCRLNIPLKIHFSLHTPIDEERYELIPSTKVSVREAFSYLINYRDALQANPIIMEKYKKLHTNDDPIEIHYTLIKDVNDQEQDLNLLCDYLSKYPIPIKFIRFNPTNSLKRSIQEDYWVEQISKMLPNLRIKTYSPPGREVGSSCGEFTKHYYHEEIETTSQKEEFERWKEEHLVEE